MKHVRISFLLASSTIFSACAYTPFHDGVAHRVSQDYTARGAVEGTRVYIYGNHTVLEFDKSPAFLSVKDEKGNAVDYERVGRYYRLNRRLDTFTTVVNGRSITFTGEPTTQTHVFSAPIPAPLHFCNCIFHVPTIQHGI